MILATGKNNEIGQDGKLPWRIKEDLAYFKKQTLNSVVVMGSKTFYSLPFDGFPERDNVVLSRSEGHNRDNIQFIDDIQWVLDLELDIPDDDIWIVGGKEVYTLFKDYVDEVHWTFINESFPKADVTFDTRWFKCDNDWVCTGKEVLTDKAIVFVLNRL